MSDRKEESSGLSRRDLLRAGVIGATGLAAVRGAVALNSKQAYTQGDGGPATGRAHEQHGANHAVGELRPGGFDPTQFLTHFEYGRTSQLPNGQTLVAVGPQPAATPAQ